MGGVVIVHVEACTHIHRSLSNIRAMGGSPSVALNPHTPAEAVENVLDLVDHVLVMTVDRGYDYDIEVDGGVKADWTIAACADAGANCFIAGSGMFKYDDLSVGCSELRTIAVDAPRAQLLN